MSETQYIVEPEIVEQYRARERYRECLALFDSALSEACAVSQATSGHFVHPSLGYATHVFTRILAHARNLVRAMPKSRWVSSDCEEWDFGANAGNFRSILEAALLFHYLIDADPEEDTQRAIVQLMHLYDLTKRSKMFHDGKLDFEGEAVRAEIVGRLQSTKRFKEIGPKDQENALKGGWLMLESKEDIMSRLGWDKTWFYVLWNLTSQYAHVYSLAFYRIEPNGRGTGIENEFDRGLLALSLETCAAVLDDMTDALCERFPEAINVRNGTNSKFAPGPSRNLPKHFKRAQKTHKKPTRR